MHSLIGKSIHDLETPSLIVDLDIFERNIEKLSNSIISVQGVKWRPHIKALKYPELVKYLLAAGATGVTCSNIDQAIKMARSGIVDIMIANEIISPSKIEKILELNRICNISVFIDSKQGVDLISDTCEANSCIRVLIEIDTGLKRSGVTPIEAIELIKYSGGKKGIKVVGLATWEAHVLDEKDPKLKKELIKSAVLTLKKVADEAKSIGFPLEVISVGGSGTYWLNCYNSNVTEIQAGGGTLGDLQYLTKYDVPVEVALSVLSTVISNPTPYRIICDSGRKYLSNHYPPSLNDNIEVLLIGLSAEHCRIEFNEPSLFKIGDKIKLNVGDCDLTMHLHNTLYGYRNGTIEKVFV